MTELEEREKLRRKRQKARKKRRRKKNFLSALTVVIVLLSAFVITIKICNPDFDYSTLIPKAPIDKIADFVNEDILGKTTTTEPQTTAKPTTTQRPVNSADYDYAEFDEFAFDTALQGNQIGNLLNKSNGTVTYSSRYIYYSIANKGIYRFEPVEEKNSKLIADDYNFTYLNVLGDYLYAIENGNTLVRIAVAGASKMNIADNVRFVYLYNDKLYYIGTDNTVGFIDTESLERTVLYTAQADKQVFFAGISLSRVFFVLYDGVGETYNEYITVSTTDKTDKKYFRTDSKGGEIINLQLEGGFMYFYQRQSDGSYSLCRQKFGSEKVVTLLENCNMTDYPVVCANRLYFTEYDIDKNRIKARELNMNSSDIKTMLTMPDADTNGSVAVGYGYQYVFLTGSKSGENGVPNDDFAFRGSCIYTSSSGDNTLRFKDGKLVY